MVEKVHGERDGGQDSCEKLGHRKLSLGGKGGPETSSATSAGLGGPPRLFAVPESSS